MNDRPKKSGFQLVWQLINEIIGGALIAAFCGFMFQWAYKFGSSYLSDTNIIVMLGPVKIIAILVGCIVGSDLTRVGVQSMVAIIIGGVAGYFLSFSFPADINIHLFSFVAITTPVVVSAALGSATGFIMTFAPKKASAATEIITKLDPEKKLKEFELAIARLKKYDLTVYTNNSADKLKIWGIRTMNKFIQEEKAKGETASLGKVPENLHTVIHEAENNIKTHPYFLYYQMFFASNKETHQVPAPPYMILDKEGHEVQRFNSLDALVIFSNSKDKPFTTLQNMTYEGFKQIENEVREFIKIGDIDNAIASLEHVLEGSQYNNFFTDLALYKSNYNKSKQLYSKNLIESSEYNRDRTRVENGILDMANSLRGIIIDKI